MERLTDKIGNTNCVKGCGSNCKYGFRYCRKEDWENCQTINDVIDKLAEYEDLEEQGRLVKLSRKVGDKLYYADSYYDVVVPVRLNEVIIRFIGINTYSYQYNCCSFDGCGDVYEEYEFDNNDFGKTVFLTKPEAEAKLKELRGGEDV